MQITAWMPGALPVKVTGQISAPTLHGWRWPSAVMVVTGQTWQYSVIRPSSGIWGAGAFLAPLTVSRVLKKLAMLADTPAPTGSKVAGHSLRVSAAQQLVLDRQGILTIMRVGGWRSMNVVARYIENVDVDVW